MEYLEFCIRDLSFPPIFFHLSYFRLQSNIYFFDQIFLTLAIRSSFSQPLCPLAYPHHCVCVCVCVRACGLFLPSFLALSDAPGLSCTFPAPVLESAISPFYWRVVLETKIWAPGALVAMQCHAARSSQLTEKGNIVYTDLRIYTFIVIYHMYHKYVLICINIMLNMSSY